MNSKQGINLEPMEGRRFIIGRDGHIYIDSGTASKHHAEISVAEGRIFLRDLDSTNGTFLVKNKQQVPFKEGFVNPLQPIMIGGKTYVIKDLLAIANDFSAAGGGETEIDTGSRPRRRPTGK